MFCAILLSRASIAPIRGQKQHGLDAVFVAVVTKSFLAAVILPLTKYLTVAVNDSNRRRFMGGAAIWR